MKKLFLSLMLIAALAFGFTSCDKTTSSSDTHSQTFTLGETTYDIDNVITIENIKYEGDENTYNAIVLSQGQMIGNTGGEGQGVAIVFKGDINPGTYNFTGNENEYPKYVFADLTVEDIVNFDIDNLDDDDAYYAISGSLTLGVDEDIFDITTDGIEVENVKDPAIVETSSVDYEGEAARYVLATVEPGSVFNNGETDANIVTAGTTKYNLMFIETQIVSFITETGDMLGFTSTTPFTNGIPTGEFTNSDYPIILIEGMNINAPKFASNGNIVIAKAGNEYTIDIANIDVNGGVYTLHYVGTMPYFDFPF